MRGYKFPTVACIECFELYKRFHQQLGPPWRTVWCPHNGVLQTEIDGALVVIRSSSHERALRTLRMFLSSSPRGAQSRGSYTGKESDASRRAS